VLTACVARIFFKHVICIMGLHAICESRGF
jgi:hypothetical protein